MLGVKTTSSAQNFEGSMGGGRSNSRQLTRQLQRKSPQAKKSSNKKQKRISNNEERKIELVSVGDIWRRGKRGFFGLGERERKIARLVE